MRCVDITNARIVLTSVTVRFSKRVRDEITPISPHILTNFIKFQMDLCEVPFSLEFSANVSTFCADYDDFELSGQ
jgi:hypothetical protein